jgi:hypothetical protein
MAQCSWVISVGVSALVLATGEVAAWPVDGAPVCVQPGYDIAPQVVPDERGGVIIVWRDGRPTPTSPDYYAQRLDPFGGLSAGWPINGVPVGLSPGAQDGSQHADNVIPDGEGGALVAWLDYRTFGQPGVPTSWDIYAQKVTASGAIAPGWPTDGVPVATQPPHFRLEVTLTSDGAGGAFVVWMDQRNGDLDIYASRLTAAGVRAPGWPEHGLPLCTLPGNQGNPHLIPDGSGGAIVAWSEGDGGILATRLTAGGEVAPGWMVGGTPVVSPPAVAGMREIVPDGAGGAYVCVEDYRTAPPVTDIDWYADIYVQRITGDGAVAAGWPADGIPVCTAPDTQWDPELVADGYGNAIVTWEDYRGADADAYASKITPSGALAPGWTPGGTRVSDAIGYQFTPRLAADGLGGAYFAYEHWNGPFRVHAQHLTADGVPAPGWSTAGAGLAMTPGQQEYPRIAADRLGGAIVAWEDSRAGGDKDIYAHRLAVDGPVPVLLALVSAEAEPGRVSLVWSAAEAAGLIASVERREEASEWVHLGSLVAGGSGRLVFEDRTVIPGARYAYRLAYAEEGVERFTPATWVDVPLALPAMLEGFRPNPASGIPVVAFTLADDSPATLEVLDVAGRRLVTRALDGLGPGRHAFPLEEGRSLAAGVYLVRLHHGGRTFLARGVVVR